ncbi:MAG TPA: diaminopimelate decarboxylase [Thiobacillaceae bacterium]|nr:diaminopimelate decarboxylase [Thiobacillaceae bacterium]
MTPFTRINGRLMCEEAPLDELAREFGTPLYVYSRAALEAAFLAYRAALESCDHLICYAVKANSNLAILSLFARLGAGFDIVSGGELKRVLAAGGDPSKVVFSGVGKSTVEMRMALEAGILCFNVESESELLHLNRVAGELGKPAPVSLRVNPDVDARTHPYISTGLRENKFGIAHDEVERLYLLTETLPHLRIEGIDCHIGSQLTDTAPYAEALDKLLHLVDRLESHGIRLCHIDVGGGLGVRYKDEIPPSTMEYAAVLRNAMHGRQQRLLIEPGRSLVANGAALLTRVEYLKHGEARDFAIVDAAMNDLMRPALYDAWHDVLPVLERNGKPCAYDIVGPICESGDFLARGRSLSLQEGDLLAILSAGAYGMSMSSNYNTRPRAAEVMIDGASGRLIRERESIESLYAGEHLLP